VEKIVVVVVDLKKNKVEMEVCGGRRRRWSLVMGFLMKLKGKLKKFGVVVK